MKIQIKNAKIWKTGSGSAVITIPAYLIKNHLDTTKKYDFEIEVQKSE